MKADPISLPGHLRGTMTASVDVEDWHQLVTRRLRGALPPCSAHVERQTHAVLDLFDALDIKGTFFVLGLVAQEKPALVRTIADRGHEIASHGISHTPLFKLTPSELRQELESSRKLLEDTCSTEVIGFRAPEFSVLPGNLEALDAIALAGYRYDSSIFPIVHRRYGVPGFPRSPCKLRTTAGHSLWELPLATAPAPRTALPLAGGGYFRLLPGTVLRRLFHFNAVRGEHAMLYCHPYEFSHQALSLPRTSLPTSPVPRMRARAWLVVQAIGRSRVRARFEQVARGGRFVRARDIITQLDTQSDLADKVTLENAS